jgi:hypothetical protein
MSVFVLGMFDKVLTGIASYFSSTEKQDALLITALLHLKYTEHWQKKQMLHRAQLSFSFNAFAGLDHCIDQSLHIGLSMPIF